MEKLNQILSENFKLSLEETSKNYGMKDVNNWDSLSHMNLIVAIEDEFNIQLTGDEIAEMTTFDKIREIVQKHI
jgi:acyl carrier protein